MEKRSVKSFIIITSIFRPTEAIEAFSRLKDHHLVVVGDKKTPAGWKHEGCTYLGVDDQLEIASSFANAIPFNHYGRKMVGYVYAMQQGADVIIDTDDDNIPYPGWKFPLFNDRFKTSQKDLGWVNIYHEYSDQVIWPRGLPLRNIKDRREKLKWQENNIDCNVGIWQGLADDDPDVDAIYRLTSNEPCIFKKGQPVVLDEGTICPFNSQNTAIRKELFPLLFLPSFVTFRFTDILRGIIAQPILWNHGFRLGFTEATVIQKRNEHDYFRDYESEVPMYLHAEKSFELVKNSIKSGSVKDNLYNAYESLLAANIVQEKEMGVLSEWLKYC